MTVDVADVDVVVLLKVGDVSGLGAARAIGNTGKPAAAAGTVLDAHAVTLAVAINLNRLEASRVNQ